MKTLQNICSCYISCYMIRLRFFFCSKLNLPNLKLNLHRKMALPLKNKIDLYNIPLLLQHIMYSHYSSVLLSDQSAQIVRAIRVSRKNDIGKESKHTEEHLGTWRTENSGALCQQVPAHRHIPVGRQHAMMWAHLLTNVKEEFSLPLPAAHRLIENITKKCVNSQISIEEFRRCSEYEVPLGPFLLLLHRTYFKICYLLPCLRLDCLSRGICFHPYYRGSRYMCHAVDATEVSKAYHRALYQNILFWKWDKVSFCNNGAHEYLWQMISVKLSNIILPFQV